MKPEVAIVAGLTKDRVIGSNGALPWDRVKDDLPNFKRLTTGHVVIMGSTTFHSIGRPLPGRHNIVISREARVIEGADVCTSIEAALKKAETYGCKIFIIGGASIYEQTLPRVNTMHLSFIKQQYAGDTLFPDFNKQEWQEVAKQEFDEFTFVTLQRKK